MLFDTHAHITSEYFEKIEEIIRSAKEAGVNRILNCSTGIFDIEEILFLCNKYDILYPALGIHPDSITSNIKQDLLLLEKYLANNKVFAIGEIGLDYYHDSNNKDIQKEVFNYQLKLAEKYNLPVLIHSRDSLHDILEILKAYDLKGIIHCYSGSYEMAKEFIKIGYKLGIGGIVTFKNCKLIDVIKKLEISDIVLETDSPFLAPTPNRGKRNEPKNIMTIAKFLSESLNIPYGELTKTIQKTSNNIFDLNN